MRSIICPRCNKTTKFKKYCEHCNKRLKKSKMPLFIIFLLLLFSYFLFSSTGFYVSVTRSQLVDEPYYVIREVNVEDPIEKEVCNLVNYRYDIVGGDVDRVGDYVRPNLGLINLENRAGTYVVNFSYMPEDRFPYETYGGENFYEKFENGEISKEDADFYSTNYLVYLQELESITIRNMTYNPYNKEYWAIAHILEPSYIDCQTQVEYHSALVNKTFTEYRKVEKETKAKEYKTITEILKIDFLGWFLMILLFYLLLLLFRKFRIESR